MSRGILVELDDHEILRAAIDHYVADVGESCAVPVPTHLCEVQRDGDVVLVRLANNSGLVARYVVRTRRGRLVFGVPARIAPSPGDVALPHVTSVRERGGPSRRGPA